MDFDYTYDVNEMIHYDGFIGRNGEFYKVSDKNTHNPTHYEWAKMFILEKTNYIKMLSDPSKSLLFTLSKLKDKVDLLIHFYGFIYYGHDSYERKPIILLPNYDFNCKDVTDKQYDSLWELLYLSNEIECFPNNLIDKQLSSQYDKYIDDLIFRTISERIKK